MLDWEPKVLFREGLKRTVEWYFADKDGEQVRRIFEEGSLTERKVRIAAA